MTDRLHTVAMLSLGAPFNVYEHEECAAWAENRYAAIKAEDERRHPYRSRELPPCTCGTSEDSRVTDLTSMADCPRHGERFPKEDGA